MNIEKLTGVVKLPYISTPLLKNRSYFSENLFRNKTKQASVKLEVLNYFKLRKFSSCKNNKKGHQKKLRKYFIRFLKSLKKQFFLFTISDKIL